MTGGGGAALRRAIAAELAENLLPFWRRHASGPTGGELVREMAADGSWREGAPRALILTARLLWTFSAVYRRSRDERDLELARLAGRTLEGELRDPVHDGYLFRVGRDGGVIDGRKKTYGQAFAIYAWSEHHLATGNADALGRARAIYELLESRARDRDNGGYLEARARDWTAAGELRLSDKDMDAAKSMNAHLHVVEAYANLHRAWPDPGLAARLRELLGLFGERILDRPAGHLRHFFDERWRPLSATYTYGHDIEAAWLLAEAAAELSDPALESEVGGWSLALARAAMAEGLDEDGALAYEGRDGRVIDRDREWWCQAEAVVGFWHAHRASGEPAFAEAAARVWSFIERRVVDRQGGEWHWRIRADGSVDGVEPKVSEWKGPYHNVRMCLEMDRRLAEEDRETA